VFANFCWAVIAISNVAAAWSLYRFTTVGISEIKQIRRSTDVVRYHILREVTAKRKAELERKA